MKFFRDTQSPVPISSIWDRDGLPSQFFFNFYILNIIEIKKKMKFIYYSVHLLYLFEKNDLEWKLSTGSPTG